MSRWIFLLLAVGAALIASEVQTAETVPRVVEVDLELVLAADRSASMIGLQSVGQRRGFAAAFRNERLYRAIGSGPLGRIAVVYVEWSDQIDQQVTVPWTLIETREDMARFADALEDMERTRPSGETSISGVMYFAQQLIDKNQYNSYRNVIDISSNGRNSDGRPVEEALKALVTRGTTVNGLILSDDYSKNAKIGDGELREYFEREVIGGPGAFVISVGRRREFSDAILRKLVMEIAWSE